jgi:hypothetical protein
MIIAPPGLRNGEQIKECRERGGAITGGAGIQK